MAKVAVMGYGVVGSGVVEVLDKNKISIASRTTEPVEVKYILDIREFKDDPFGHLVTNDFEKILNAVSIIALITFLMCFVGVFIGKKVGNTFKEKAEILGGLILIGIGAKILIEHLFF